MSKTRLGVNIDHVATVRNARGENYPSPLEAAIFAQKNGADSITIHLREDRRHINENDIKSLLSKLKIPLNFEMAATSEMINFAVENLPYACCIVPEKRQEITTEGGLNLKSNKEIVDCINKLKDAGIFCSLFIEHFIYLNFSHIIHAISGQLLVKTGLGRIGSGMLAW